MPGDYGAAAVVRREIRTAEKQRDTLNERLDQLKQAENVLAGIPSPRRSRRRRGTALNKQGPGRPRGRRGPGRPRTRPE